MPNRTGRLRILARCPLIFLMVSLTAWTARADDLSGGIRPNRYDLHFSAGYLHTMEKLTTVWRDGFLLDASFVYRPRPALGLELGGTLGYTAMTEKMKNRVLVYEPATDRTRHRTSAGGGYYGVSLGPRYDFLRRPRVVLSTGAGVHYGSQQESGMDRIEGYTTRWTFGWGYYALLAGHRSVSSGRVPLQVGLQLRYTQTRAKVNDFYYDRVYGADRYDAIPATYEQDRRLMTAVDLAFRF